MRREFSPALSINIRPISADIKNRAKSPEIRHRNTWITKSKISTISTNINYPNARNGNQLFCKKTSVFDQNKSHLSSFYWSIDESMKSKAPDNIIVFNESYNLHSPNKAENMKNYQRSIHRPKHSTNIPLHFDHPFSPKKSRCSKRKSKPMFSIELKNKINESLNFDKIQSRANAKIDIRISQRVS